MDYAAFIISTVALLIYFYKQDVNKEPFKRLAEAFLLGVALSLQVNYFQQLLPRMPSIFFTAFISAALIEEGIKLITLRLTLFRNPDFKEKVDGITYAVFLGLGFATVENLIWITNFEIGLVRAFTATPAHALFGVVMGYYLGRYKFEKDNQKLLYQAFWVPTLLHGLYNLLILTGQIWGVIFFIPYVAYLWVRGIKKLDKLNKKARGRIGRKNDKLDQQK